MVDWYSGCLIVCLADVERRTNRWRAMRERERERERERDL